MTGRLWMIRSTRPSRAITCPVAICPEIRVLPKTCDSGSHMNWMSSARSSPLASWARPSYAQQSCTRRTPLGRPVVPEV